MGTIVSVLTAFIALSMNVFGAVGMLVIVPALNLTALQKAVVLNALAPYIVIVVVHASIIDV